MWTVCTVYRISAIVRGRVCEAEQGRVHRVRHRQRWKHLRGKKHHTAALIALAYGIGDYRVEGPGWLGSERFDVNAKCPTDVPAGGQKADAAFRAMMQKMLTNGFRLVVHRSQKTVPVYGLVVAKRGLKVDEVKESGTD